MVIPTHFVSIRQQYTETIASLCTCIWNGISLESCVFLPKYTTHIEYDCEATVKNVTSGLLFLMGYHKLSGFGVRECKRPNEFLCRIKNVNMIMQLCLLTQEPCPLDAQGASLLEL